ncbi:5-formyltetrahydrofolate cyclo-ligase [Prosthecomicrobium pneumaticum]|uniref:5-formyltetrahydrofolate cyclo-ligase n=1 Tax=Prosthecomicrobium pneumaticum TaxID=81895 RepID=A0A7W9FKK0_9HYPH|nr:5-formyltetrahydrofolate cyclo-ligase [Prosthecomicrobium pneumaticum]MBB5752620.1 5-formyltetrahydrofolate cyclo-ligase [Prosthecomicrobium pneumaticum]
MTAVAATPAARKQALRIAALGRRDRLDAGHRAAAAAAVVRHALALAPLAGAATVSAYHPIRSELDPGPLVAALRAGGASIALPVLVDAETMRFRLWDEGERLVPAGFGTLGPPAGAAEARPDALLVPLAAFDGSGFRIGYGKGHYDRAIAAFHAAAHRPFLVGLAFAAQAVDKIPAEPHDIPLDAIVTEDGVIVPAGSGRMTEA